MNIHELAARLPQHRVEQYQRSKLWAETASGWPHALTCPFTVSGAWDKLSSKAANTLQLILARFGALPFTEEQLLKSAAPDKPGIDIRLGLIKLLQDGIVFAYRKGWGEQAYCLPADTFYCWSKAAFFGHHDFCEALYMNNLAIEEAAPALGTQMIRVLAESAKTGGKWTSKGILDKRIIGKRTSQISFSSKEIGVLFPADLTDSYPIELAFMLDIAYRKTWLIRKDNQLVINEMKVDEDLLNCSTIKRESDMLNFVMNNYAVRHAGIALAAAALILLKPLYWYSLDILEKSINKLCKTGSSRAILESWSRMMNGFGWMETAKDQAGAQYIRWLVACTSEGEQTEGSYPAVRIMPDGEVFVPPDAAGYSLWLLECCAERLRSDIYTTYRLSESSVRKAVCLGYTAEKLIDKLERICLEPLPASVRLSLEHWMNITEASNSNWDKSQTGQRVLPLLEEGSLGAYELIEPPNYEVIVKGLKEIPVAWTKELRNYHASTRRELMEKALYWRSSVKLQCNGQNISFIPLQIVDEHEGNWAVCGWLEERREQVRLYPEMWTGMMINLPNETKDSYLV